LNTSVTNIAEIDALCSVEVVAEIIIEVDPDLTPVVDTEDEETILCDDNTENNESQARSLIQYPPFADLKITKTANVSTIAPGGEITYTLTYENIGNQGFYNGFTVSDTLPA
jgi:uncharacterized repeat protein (TIGR01451 family)